MRPGGVVVDSPGFDNAAGVGQVGEPVFVEAFISEFAVEGLDKGVLERLAGINEVQTHALAITAADRVIASRSFSSTLKQSKELEAASFGLIASVG